MVGVTDRSDPLFLLQPDPVLVRNQIAIILSLLDFFHVTSLSMHACLANSFLQFYVAGKIGLYVNIASNIRIFCLFIEGVVFCFKVSEIFSVEKGL